MYPGNSIRVYVRPDRDVQQSQPFVRAGIELRQEGCELPGIDRTGEIRPSQARGIRRRRDVDGGARHDGIASTEGCDPCEQLEVVEGRVNGLGGADRQAGDGPALTIRSVFSIRFVLRLMLMLRGSRVVTPFTVNV
jgi:hypothetical protein